jgi:hypothetical protein
MVKVNGQIEWYKNITTTRKEEDQVRSRHKLEVFIIDFGLAHTAINLKILNAVANIIRTDKKFWNKKEKQLVK